MSGIAVIRVPNNSEQDASEVAIRNLLSISKGVFEDRIVFEQKFLDMGGISGKPVNKKGSSNLIVNLFHNLKYQFALSQALVRENDRIDTTLWHAGGFSLFLPIVVSRLLGHRMFVCVLGWTMKGYLNDDFWEKEGYAIGKTPLKFGFAFVVGILETFSFLLCTRIIVFSENMNDYLTLRLFAHKTRVLKYNYQEIPDTQPLSSRSYPIVYLGRVCELKGADRLGSAIRHLEERDELNGQALIVGDGNLRPELERELAPYNVEFTGWVSRVEALELVADSKLFVLPSRSEGLPKALLEAMARGTIPIVTPVGDIPNVVTSGTNGILISDPSPESIAGTIKGLLEVEKSDMSEEAISTIRESFSYAAAERAFEELIEETDAPI